jgi:hypothetical protein
MFNSQLTLESRSIDYDDDTTFVIKANNKYCAVLLDFYGTTEEFKDFGSELVNFPLNINQEVHCPPLGSYDENLNYAYWLTIKVYCYDQNGHVALEITVNNHELQPRNYQAKFCIETDPATINKFGQRLRGWDVRELAEISLFEEKE